jgi:hypothetical protein
MDHRLTRPYLESLATQELTALAETRGIDIPPALERVFIIEELLDSVPDDESRTAEAAPPLGKADYLESVPLPKHYNITYLDVLIRDPLWVFAFWEINARDKELYEGAPDFGGYLLKVCPRDLPGTGPGENSFTVPVGAADTAWYLGFPPGEGWFKVELCVLRGGVPAVLAVSRPFRVPALLDPSGRAEGWNRFSILSGLDELPVLRNMDRLSRLHRGQIS